MSWKCIPSTSRTQPNSSQLLPRIPSPKPAISHNLGEIKQMDLHMPTCPSHLTIFCRSYSGPNVWRGSWLARASFFFLSLFFFFFFNLFCCSCKIEKEERKNSNLLLPKTFLGKYAQLYLFIYLLKGTRTLHIFAYTR